MAVRFDASTDRCTGGGISGSVATITCWAYISVDRNDFSNLWLLYNTLENSPEAGLGTLGDGVSIVAYDSAFNTITGPTMTVGVWYCFALVMNGTSWTLYWGTDPASLSSASGTMVAISSPTNFVVSSAGDWFNGREADLKAFERAASAGNAAAELATYSVVDATNLVRVHDFQTAPGTTNGGGTGGNLTAGSTATSTEAGPTALDVLTGAVTQAITAGATVTGTADHVGAVSQAITAGATVTGFADHVGTAGSSVVAGAVVTGTADHVGAVTQAITAGATVTGESTDPGGVVTSAITAGATVTGTADHTGSTGSAIVAGAVVTGTVESYGQVVSVITTGASVAGIDLDRPLVLPLRAGTPVFTPAWRTGTVVLEPAWTAGEPVGP